MIPKLLRNFKVATFILMLVAILIPIFVLSIIAVNTVNTRVETVLEHNLVEHASATEHLYSELLSGSVVRLQVPLKTKFFIDLVKEKNRNELRPILEGVRVGERVDIVTLVDTDGIVISRANGDWYGDRLLLEGFVPWVLERGVPVVSTEEISFKELEKEGFVDDVRVEQVPTPHATEKEYEPETALARVAVVPVFSDGEVIAGIVVVDVLNRDTAFLEHQRLLHDTHASIFHGNVRIATTVTTDAGNQYVGTLLADEVSSATLEKGEVFVGKTWAVYDWGRAIYYPIRNHRNSTIGVLGIGRWDSSFRANEGFLGGWDIANILILNTIIVAGLAVILTIFVVRRITKPIDGIVDAAESVGRGDLEHDVHLDTYDEFDKLSAAFNAMKDSLRRQSVETERNIVKKYKELLEGR